MTDETDAEDLKALELEHLRAVEATLDEIAREIAEMKAEAQRCGACILNSPLSG